MKTIKMGVKNTAKKPEEYQKSTNVLMSSTPGAREKITWLIGVEHACSSGNRKRSRRGVELSSSLCQSQIMHRARKLYFSASHRSWWPHVSFFN
jgi:hypothetical protein